MEVKRECHDKEVIRGVCKLFHLLIVLFLTVTLVECGMGEVKLDPELQKIASYRFGENRENLTVVADLVRASYGNPDERLHLEKQFIKILKSDATLECKDFICRQLWIMGADESVPVLARMLTDETTSDMARYALHANPGSKAGKALRKALSKTRGKMLIGIINTLGERHDKKSIKALEKLASDSENAVASAATAALGKITRE